MVGFGVAVGVQKQKTCVFVVARYFLPGNVGGQNKFNVFKGSFNEKQCAAHAFTPQTTVGGTILPSTSGSSVKNDGGSMYGTSSDDDEDMENAGENPDGDLVSQLDKKPQTGGVLSTGIPKVTASVSSVPPSIKPAIAGAAPKVTSTTPPAVAPPAVTPPAVAPPAVAPPAVTPGTSPLVTAKQPQQHTLGPNPVNTGPSKQIFGPNKAKASTTGALPSGSATTGSGSSTSPVAIASSTTALSQTSGSVTTQQPATTSTGTQPSPGIVGSGGTSTGAQPSTGTTGSGATSTGAQPSPGTTGSGAISAGAQPSPGATGGGAASTGPQPVSANTGPSKQILRPVTTNTQTAPSTSSTTPPSTTPPSTTATNSPASGQPATPTQNGINLNKHLYPNLGYKIGRGSTYNDVKKMDGSESVWPAPSPTMEMDNEMMFKDIDKFKDDMNDDMDDRLNNEALEDDTGQIGQFNNNDLFKDEAQSLFSHENDNDMDSSFREKPLQNNAHKSLKDNSKVQMNQLEQATDIENNFQNQQDTTKTHPFNHVNGNNMDQRLQNQPTTDNTKEKYGQFNPNHHGVNNMDQRIKELPINDNTNQFNHKLPTIETGRLNLEQFEPPSKIDLDIIHPWVNQHSRHQYRDPDSIENSNNLAGNQQKDTWANYDNSMGSDVTFWKEQELEGGTKDKSGTYKDIYENMSSEYKEPYYDVNDINEGYEESYKDNKRMDGTFRGNEEMVSTYRETSYDGASMCNDIDTKAYLKQPKDNMGYIDTNLVENSHDSKGLQGINGLSSEGGVGLPLQEYADELGQVRQLHRKRLLAKEDKIKNNKNPNTKH